MAGAQQEKERAGNSFEKFTMQSFDYSARAVVFSVCIYLYFFFFLSCVL